MNGWIKGTLGGLCSIEIGGTPSRSNPEFWDSAKDTSNRWVSIRDLNRRTVCETAEYITDLGVCNSNVKLQPKGSVLLSFKLSIGKVAFAGCDLYTNEAIAGLRSEALTPEFLFHGLQQWNLLQNVDQAIKGATLNKDKLKKIEFEYPESRIEQAKISEVLDMLDRAIEQTEMLIAKQQRIKTGLMQDLLTKGIDENGNIRSEASHRFKDSPLGRIPVEWEAVKVEQVLAENPKNGYSPKESASFTDTLMLGLGCLTTEGFEAVQLKNAPPDDPRVHGALLKHGDFLISRSNTRELVGLVGIFKDIATKCIYPDLMVRLRFNDSVSSGFMEHAFRHHILRRQITGAAVGTSGSMVKINARVIKSCRFLRPPFSEQGTIVSILGESAGAILKMNEHLEKLHSLKRGLMHDFLTGERRVTPLLVQAAAQ